MSERAILVPNEFVDALHEVSVVKDCSKPGAQVIDLMDLLKKHLARGPLLDPEPFVQKKGVSANNGQAGKPDKGTCEHGLRPWWDCEACCKTKTYSFNGNFR